MLPPINGYIHTASLAKYSCIDYSECLMLFFTHKNFSCMRENCILKLNSLPEKMVSRFLSNICTKPFFFFFTQNCNPLTLFPHLFSVGWSSRINSTLDRASSSCLLLLTAFWRASLKTKAHPYSLPPQLPHLQTTGVHQIACEVSWFLWTLWLCKALNFSGVLHQDINGAIYKHVN